MSIINTLVDLIYGTKRVVKAYKNKYPDQEVIAASGVKAVRSTPQTEIKTGAHWVTAKRAVAILTNDRIICKDWEIFHKDIKSAELIRFKSLLSKGQVLNITTNENVGYQFGMQRNTDWTKCKTLELNYVDKKIKMSTFSIVIRLFLVGYIAYLLYERFLQ